MSRGWAWVAGTVVALCIVAMILFVRSERQAYWNHHAIVVRYAQQGQEQHRPDRVIFWRISR